MADQRPSGHLLAVTRPPGQYQFSGQTIGRLYRGEQNWPGRAVQAMCMFRVGDGFYKGGSVGF
jgi:hypothetical protein